MVGGKRFRGVLFLFFKIGKSHSPFYASKRKCSRGAWGQKEASPRLPIQKLRAFPILLFCVSSFFISWPKSINFYKFPFHAFLSVCVLEKILEQFLQLLWHMAEMPKSGPNHLAWIRNSTKWRRGATGCWNLPWLISDVMDPHFLKARPHSLVEFSMAATTYKVLQGGLSHCHCLLDLLLLFLCIACEMPAPPLLWSVSRSHHHFPDKFRFDIEATKMHTYWEFPNRPFRLSNNNFTYKTPPKSSLSFKRKLYRYIS